MGSRARACALLVIVGLVPVGSAMADTGPSLAVDAAAARRPISPYIYGWNFVPADIGQQIGVTVDRRGGNSADTLNWQTGVENHSNDFFFENIPSCWTDCPVGWDAHRAFTDQIDADRTFGAKSLIDIPMLGYVPKDDGAADFQQPLPCSFTRALFPAQNSFGDQFDPDCGDGHQPDPNQAQWVTNTAQTATATADTPAIEAPWIDFLKGKYNDAADGGVVFYETGNEPGLWNSTHHDWHPQPTTAQELWDDMRGIALMVKDRDPTAQVIGPAEWGWPNYFCSAADGGCGPGGPNAPGANSDWTLIQGGIPVLPWILKQFKEYSDAHNGLRLLDYLDLHYYRQESSSGIEGTRSLWDPRYKDTSSIDDTIQLIPRMRKWVSDYYPGTKTSVSEYDLAVDGGDTNTHIDLDNLIEADVLGIFGREGVDLATLWPETNDLNHYTGAFKLFRNYDGNHSAFGDGSISSTSSDQSKLAVYGASRATDNALTLVVVNKSGTDLTSSVALANFTAGATAQVWRWTTVAGGVQRAEDVTVSSTGFSATFPARSMSMVVIPPAGATQQQQQQQQDNQNPVVDNSAPPSGPTSTTTSTPPPTAAAARCTVPKLAGLTLKKAKAKLRRAHCALGKVTRKHSNKRRGRVIAQKPKPGTHGKPGMRVALVLSRGR